MEAFLPEPFSLCSYTLACPVDSPQDITQESLQDNPQDNYGFQGAGQKPKPGRPYGHGLSELQWGYWQYASSKRKGNCGKHDRNESL